MADALYQPFPMVTGRKAQAWRHQPAYRRPRHFHEEPEINVILRGRGIMGIGDCTQEVVAGDVLTFHPGQDHVLLEESDDFDLFVVALRPQLMDRAAVRVVKSTIPFRLEEARLGQLGQELRDLGDVSDPVCHELRLTELFKSIQLGAISTHVICRRALRSVVDAPEVSGAVLARRLRTDRSAISRQYHGDLGMKFVEHRSRMRIIQFLHQVDQGKGLTTAAMAAHFGSYSQLHRVFRRTFGCAPREYFEGARELLNEATFMDLDRIRASLNGAKIEQSVSPRKS